MSEVQDGRQKCRNDIVLCSEHCLNVISFAFALHFNWRHEISVHYLKITKIGELIQDGGSKSDI
jgi:hypothetical protein